jgi:hypothetical protein
MTWKDYLNNKLIKECDGYCIIKPKNFREITPIACPVCDYLLRTGQDEKSYRQFSCCESCELLWARPRQEEWRNGWRPDKEQVMNKVGRKTLNVDIKI